MRELAAPREGTGFGSGWISGVLSALLGLMSFGAVLCLRYPALLTSPQLREFYPLPLMRALIHTVLIAAFALGLISLILRRNKILGSIGLGSSLAAALLGGAGAEVGAAHAGSNYLGLDWFLLDLFLLALLFVPMERLFFRLEQRIFRRGWDTDATHFLFSHIGAQLLTLLTMTPAAVAFRWLVDSPFQQTVGAQPNWLQFLEIVIVADFAGYWIHRLFHVVPVLWRFHSIHHSSQTMDWLAGSRLHLVDIVVTRAFAFAPLYACGFDTTPVYAYLVFVSFHAVFVHANVRWRFPVLGKLVGTPHFHHWHHAVDPVDKNFAIHVPAIDWLFGTLHQPDGWPDRYGIEGNPVPEGYVRQQVWPFER